MKIIMCLFLGCILLSILYILIREISYNIILNNFKNDTTNWIVSFIYKNEETIGRVVDVDNDILTIKYNGEEHIMRKLNDVGLLYQIKK